MIFIWIYIFIGVFLFNFFFKKKGDVHDIQFIPFLLSLSGKKIYPEVGKKKTPHF